MQQNRTVITRLGTGAKHPKRERCQALWGYMPRQRRQSISSSKRLGTRLALFTVTPSATSVTKLRTTS